MASEDPRAVILRRRAAFVSSALVATGCIEEFEFLLEKGCYQYQGYYFSRPLNLDEFNDRLAQRAAIQPTRT